MYLFSPDRGVLHLHKETEQAEHIQYIHTSPTRKDDDDIDNNILFSLFRYDAYVYVASIGTIAEWWRFSVCPLTAPTYNVYKYHINVTEI